MQPIAELKPILNRAVYSIVCLSSLSTSLQTLQDVKAAPYRSSTKADISCSFSDEVYNNIQGWIIMVIRDAGSVRFAGKDL